MPTSCISEESTLTNRRVRAWQRCRWPVFVALAAVLIGQPVQAQDAGELDTSFGTDGLVTTDFAMDSADIARDVLILDDGRIVAAGSAGAPAELALARYGADGALDSGFGTAGLVTLDASGQPDEGYALGRQSDGRLIVAGQGGPVGGTSDFVLARFATDGALDTAFGSGGVVLTGSAAREEGIRDIAVQGDDKIVAVGFSGPEFAVVRYLPDGSLDTSFAGDGSITLGGLGVSHVAHAVAVQPDGKIVVAGLVEEPAPADGTSLALLRFNADGTLDLGFGTDGVVVTDLMVDMSVANDIALQADNRIVVAGAAGEDFAVARYDTDGTGDATFGTNGAAVTDVSGGDDEAHAVAVQADGKIVLAGRAGSDFALVRYLPEGVIDPDFGSMGTVTTAFGASTASTAFGLEIDGEGRLLAGGVAGEGTAQDLALARYLAVDSTDGGDDGDNGDPGDTVGPVIVLREDAIRLWPPNHTFAMIHLADFVVSVSDDASAGSSGSNGAKHDDDEEEDENEDEGEHDDGEDDQNDDDNDDDNGDDEENGEDGDNGDDNGDDRRSIEFEDGELFIAAVTSDEAEDAPEGDGHTFNDMVIGDECETVQLRSERNGEGDGRVYTITVAAIDDAGNRSEADFNVVVPKSQGQGMMAVDSGPVFTVFGDCEPDS